MDECIKKMQQIHIPVVLEYYSAIKIDEFETFATTWMDLP